MLLIPVLLSAAALRFDGAVAESCAEVGGLRSWLCHLSFDIPDERLTLDGFHIDLEDMRCGSVLLGELSSSISSAGAPAPTFRLRVEDLGLNCTVGRFSFKSFIISGSGSATVLVRSATIETGIELELEGNLAVAAKQVAHPTMVIGEIDIELHGSVLVKIADQFKGLIERALKKQLPKPILGLLDGLIADNVTSALQSLDHWVRPYLNATSPLPEPHASLLMRRLVRARAGQPGPAPLGLPPWTCHSGLRGKWLLPWAHLCFWGACVPRSSHPRGSSRAPPPPPQSRHPRRAAAACEIQARGCGRA